MTFVRDNLLEIAFNQTTHDINKLLCFTHFVISENIFSVSRFPDINDSGGDLCKDRFCILSIAFHASPENIIYLSFHDDDDHLRRSIMSLKLPLVCHFMTVRHFDETNKGSKMAAIDTRKYCKTFFNKFSNS